ncbi:MAG: aldehyde ferredoxin oxidoreductase N-terminal domain-containing protein [Candidatus Methanofastidiosia archaeon]|jgi:aldehyde:ferredoxin oxidoreductase
MEMYTDLIAVVDLKEGEIEEIDMDEEFIEANIGGAAANVALLEEYPGSVVLGTGILTGSLYPGSALGVVTAEKNGSICHSAFNWFGGTELKLSGFSFVVLKGKSDEPVYLWLHDEILDIEKTDLWGKNTWETTDFLREELGEDRIQTLVIGPGGENQSGAALLVNNYWGTDDRNGLAAHLGEKNVKAVAMRGMGEIEISEPEDFVATAEDVLNDLKLKIKKRGAPIEGLDDITQRKDACFNCPYACRNFVMTGDEGVLIYERHINDLMSQGVSLKDAVKTLKDCYTLGVNPAYGTDPASLVQMDPQPVVPLEGKEPWYYTMGICPILDRFSPDEDSVIDLLNTGTGIEFTKDSVKKIISRV